MINDQSEMSEIQIVLHSGLKKTYKWNQGQ